MMLLFDEHFNSIPIVAIDADGRLLHDGSGTWFRENR
jgi:hypothetical protein